MAIGGNEHLMPKIGNTNNFEAQKTSEKSKVSELAVIPTEGKKTTSLGKLLTNIKSLFQRTGNKPVATEIAFESSQPGILEIPNTTEGNLAAKGVGKLEVQSQTVEKKTKAKPKKVKTEINDKQSFTESIGKQFKTPNISSENGKAIKKQLEPNKPESEPTDDEKTNAFLRNAMENKGNNPRPLEPARPHVQTESAAEKLKPGDPGFRYNYTSGVESKLLPTNLKKDIQQGVKLRSTPKEPPRAPQAPAKIVVQSQVLNNPPIDITSKITPRNR